METGLPNREFKVVFKPKDITLYPGKKEKKFGIGSRSIAKYIGESNAKVVVKKALECKKDSLICKFRATGTIYIYLR